LLRSNVGGAGEHTAFCLQNKPADQNVGRQGARKCLKLRRTKNSAQV
jgi:hypothetical protein